jgi:microcystin synthetase protein McyJ
MRQFFHGINWTVRSALRALTLVRQNDAVAYYTLMGDDVIDHMHEGYTDASKPMWLNLGYWKTAHRYPDACVAMAELLGTRAGLKSGNRVLDVGFGFAEQDFVFVDRFDVDHITAIDITPVHVEKGRDRVRQRGRQERIEIRLGSATAMNFPDASFDNVVALESAFHFNTREAFLREAMRVLKPGGAIAIADMLPKPGQHRRVWARLCRQYGSMPEANYYDRNEYARRLTAIGFDQVHVESIREHVYPGMAQYMWKRVHERKKSEDVVVEVTDHDRATCRGIWLWERVSGISDYVIASARKPIDR